MAEKLDNIIVNLKQGSAWVRVILMIAFAVVLYVIIPGIVLVLMLTQTLFVFITGDSNENLRVLGTALSKYIFEVLQFLSYASDNRPFPFSGFPSVENDDFSFNTEENMPIMIGTNTDDRDDEYLTGSINNIINIVTSA